MKNKLEYFFFLLFGYFFSLLGLKAARRTAGIFSFLVFYLIPVRKKVVIENLQFAFPDFDRKKVTKTARLCYKSFIITLIEILCIRNLSREKMERQVKVTNINLISEKFKEGKGIILLSAHLGNWEYLASSVSMQINIPFNIVVKSQRNPYVDEWINSMRTKWINNVVPLGVSIRNVYQQLKNGSAVAMVADQRGPAEGVKLNFFGRNTSVYTGPAVLSLKTGAPVIYGIAVRQADYTYTTTLYEVDLCDLPDSDEDKIIEITRRSVSYLESVIREYPDQWLWMHKRWKH